jgi:hypothetical protein
VIQTQLAPTKALDVAESIEDREGIAAFQDSHPIVDPL